jgi:methyltransferase (TIGR00027 family)
MIAGKRSVTAERVAIGRAAHQLRDDPRVFDDPLALRIIGENARRAIEAAGQESAPYVAFLRAFLAARSRLAESELADAYARGVRRYIVLGAGLDTFAYRNSFADLQVIEVDHPATQAWKRERLAEADILTPASVTFAPIDFATEDLGATLRGAGAGAGDSSFVSWLGVTPYLERDAIETTLTAVGGVVGPDGGLVFDYVTAARTAASLQRAFFQHLVDRLKEMGEPFRTFLEPKEVVEFLPRAGFRRVTDWSPDEINAGFFAGRSDGLRVGGLGRIVAARP